ILPRSEILLHNGVAARHFRHESPTPAACFLLGAETGADRRAVHSTVPYPPLGSGSPLAYPCGMDFFSDNSVGASPRVMAASAAANDGSLSSYGKDDWTQAVEARFAAIFEHEVSVFLVLTGTAANALALASITRPWGAILAHQEAHVCEDECGAPEFFT